MSTRNRETFINWENFERVFKQGQTPERRRFQPAIDYARNVTTTDLHAFRRLQDLFNFVLVDYHMVNPFDLEDLGVSAREKIHQLGRHGAYDYRAMFDILAGARYANRKLAIADDRGLNYHRQRKSEVMARLQTRDANEHNLLTAQHDIAKLIEQYIIDGKLSFISEPLTQKF